MKALRIKDTLYLITKSDRPDYRILELWIIREVLKDDLFWNKKYDFNREFYKDEYIKELSKEIQIYREQILELENILYSRTEKIVQENKNLVTNYDLAKILENKFKVIKTKN